MHEEEEEGGGQGEGEGEEAKVIAFLGKDENGEAVQVSLKHLHYPSASNPTLQPLTLPFSL